MLAVCNGIYKKQHKAGLNVSTMGAMDIGCGYHSYLFAIARWQKQVKFTDTVCATHSIISSTSMLPP